MSYVCVQFLTDESTGKSLAELPNLSQNKQRKVRNNNDILYNIIFVTKNCKELFYVYDSVHHWSILIIVQREITQSSIFIILQVNSTCFGRQKIRPVPEVIVTVLCTPDDGCGWHSKHVQWTCRIINRLLCVVARWTIINIYIKRISPNGLPLETKIHDTFTPNLIFYLTENKTRVYYKDKTVNADWISITYLK